VVRLYGAIIDNINSGNLNARISLVVSDNPTAFALERAKQNDIPTYIIGCRGERLCSPGSTGSSTPTPEERDVELAEELRKYDVDLIVLAGYLKKIGNRLIDEYTIINTHPSLLPAYGGKGMYGMKVHTAVVNAKEDYSGPTVHYVNDKYDEGDIIAQTKVILEDGETPESLSAKVQAVEKIQLVEVIKKFIDTWCS